MKGTLAWIIFGLASATCLLWIGFGVRDDLREDNVFHDVIQKRIALSKASANELHIGAGGNWKHHETMLQGIEIAAAEINANGGILGRKIILDCRDDQGTINGALTIAQSFATKPEIAFVIGHTELELNAAVAQNYEFYGLMSLSPNTAGSSSSVNPFSLLFENGTPPEQTCKAILKLAKEKGWSRLGLFYVKSDQTMQQARRFESIANRHEIQIPLSFGYEGRGSGIAMRMEHWKRELDLDAIVLAVRTTDIANLVSASRALGIDCPFIVAGKRPTAISSDKTDMFGSMYFLEPAQKTIKYKNFAKLFQIQFGKIPSAEALQGYDSVHILAQAIKKADSFVPVTVASALKDSQIDNSLSGTVRFDQQGNAIKKPLRFIKY
ncbi:MAG: ABC transporter substrate-binding protein [Pseudodesulfovibrio sp.]|nr:ABC transporter substrate-binding protein [Pseudodesulfovibrio sp.]